MFEIYKSEENKPKTYLVADIRLSEMKSYVDDQKLEDFIRYSMRYFKVKPNRLFMTSVWILNDEMYLADPHKRGTKQRTAICMVNKELLSNISFEK